MKSSKSKKADKSTCWYDENKTPLEMIKGVQGILWPKLEHSDHFPALKELLENIPKEYSTLLELGCGGADFSRVFPNYFYVGADLSHIINKVARVLYPNNRYIEFDIYNDACEFISDYDIVVMNAFIDVLEYPVECLKKVLSLAKKFVVIHRQSVDSTETKVISSYSYGHMKSYLSIINVDEFNDILNKNGFMIKNKLQYSFLKSSYLLEKI